MSIYGAARTDFFEPMMVNIRHAGGNRYEIIVSTPQELINISTCFAGTGDKLRIFNERSK